MLIVTDPVGELTDTRRAVAALHTLFGLTATEAEVAIRVAQGLSGPEVATALGIGAGTVHSHLKNVFEKTGVRRQSSLARLLTRIGVLDSN